MKNDVANVSTTRGVKGGYVFRAPLGTPLPTDIRTPLNPDVWVNIGFVASDGFKWIPIPRVAPKKLLC